MPSLARPVAFALLLAVVAPAFAASEEFSWAPRFPGKATCTFNKGIVRWDNAAISAVVKLEKGHFRLDRIENHYDRSSLDLHGAELFEIRLANGTVLRPSSMKGDGPSMDLTKGGGGSSQRASGKPGPAPVIMFHDPKSGIEIFWQGVLRDDTNYFQQRLALRATKADVNIASIRLLDLPLPSATVSGKTPGSPIVAGNIFAGLEHPMAKSQVADGRATSEIERKVPLRRGTSVTYQAVIGVSSPGQMRRAFLTYIENERAHPYRPFLHYNSWYDIGYFTPYSAKDCIDRIDKFGKALVQDRGVRLDSFLFDDGWDNYQSVWEFHSGFPQSFLPVKDEARKFGAGPGVWLSPWGGYGKPRETRLAFGKAHGMEVDSQGYALSGPKYYKRFREVTLDFVRRQGINQFKFDGTGSPDKNTPGSAFDSDFDAAISLIGDLRAASPDLFINLTTGTWPSPFWLRTADSIWRGGSDHSFAGVGTNRQQWITYRDSDTYHGIVERGPLFPLNSLMLHGLIYAQHAHNLDTDPGNDFRDEIHDYFGNGTQLQEMYITPDLLTSKNWDDLAEAAKWSRANASVLKDTHWVGGDPSKLDVYGWASWSAGKSILVLRNPSDKPQAFSVDIAAVLELPPAPVRGFRGKSPWKGESVSYDFPVGQSRVVMLKPFQVLVLDLQGHA